MDTMTQDHFWTPGSILYKKTSTGALQYWEIRVHDRKDAAEIHTHYGQVGTESPQVTVDKIFLGKNIGKKNETSRLEQAQAEAYAKWEKQKKRRGYVETITGAEQGEVDALVLGGILPMLAHSFPKQGHKITFPAYAQPKLDGIRCSAILQNGTCTLWSRERNQFFSVPHISNEIEKVFGSADIMLDGELYNHEYKHRFETITSLVRQDTPHPDCSIVQYHVYDTPINNTDWETRWHFLCNELKGEFQNLRLVETTLVDEPEEVLALLEDFLRQGYEGLMLRNRLGMYVNKRSYDLQKLKKFDDDEFAIIGVKEGRGKLMGHVGSFVCQDRAGQTFDVKLAGTTDRLRECWDDHSLWTGKKMTVKYQGLTGKNNVPRFPVGVAIRDYE
jgi:ATP-dependent DNA ligase